MDGGLGEEVFRKAGKPRDPLWSSQVLMNEPALVKEAHQDFIRAGAQIITINSYSATPTRLERDGDKDWFEDLQNKAFLVAAEAREELGYTAQEVQIAGCLPPLIGSYSSDPRSFAELKEEYQQIVAIQSSRVDLWIIETISVLREAQAALEAAVESGKPVLLSFTLSDEDSGKLRSGESIRDVLPALPLSQLDGLLFNCSFPETIGAALASLNELAIPYGGYANGFTSVEPLKPGGSVDALEARQDLTPQNYARQVMDWVAGGATMVGGCCEVGPQHIAELRRQLKNQGYALRSLHGGSSS